MNINCRGKILDLSQPKVMGILNMTPDSFFDGGKHNTLDLAIGKVNTMIKEGVDIIDIGGMSSRPGAEQISPSVEIKRVVPIITYLSSQFPDTILSIDTVHGETVKAAYDAGIHMVNDISAGNLSSSLIEEVVKLNLPYVLMHMQGRPENMQDSPAYKDVVLDIQKMLKNKIRHLRKKGLKDIIIDPGFGFGKSVEDNYSLLNQLDSFHWLACPILVGLSRKSMIYKVLESNPESSLNATTALHMVALQKGAKILRVHDVKEAKEVVKMYEALHGI